MSSWIHPWCSSAATCGVPSTGRTCACASPCTRRLPCTRRSSRTAPSPSGRATRSRCGKARRGSFACATTSRRPSGCRSRTCACSGAHGRWLRRQELRGHAHVRRRAGSPADSARRCAASSIAKASRWTPGTARATEQVITLGATRDGTLTAIDLEAIIPLGVSGWQAGPGQLYHELYRCANVRTRETFVHVNTGGDAGLSRTRVRRGRDRARARDGRTRARARDGPLALRLHNFPTHDQRRTARTRGTGSPSASRAASASARSRRPRRAATIASSAAPASPRRSGPPAAVRRPTPPCS